MSEAAIIGSVSILAMVVGPILAVVVTRCMDNHRAVNDRRMDVFRSLMKTRKARLTSEHVAALNLVEIEFYKCKEVTSALKDYFASLSQKAPDNEADVTKLYQQQDQLLAKLLHAMAKALKFPNLEQIDIMTGGYTPQYWADLEYQQHIIRWQLIDLLNGNRALPISPVVNPTPQSPYPPPPEEPSQTISLPKNKAIT